ncbi:MAG: hypothetical protein KHX13_04795 [Acidaminococcus intestini]|uniref:DUF2815 family protein n=1 Tax=Acidaminococcus intestini TaxID=187327 RepID=A0A943I296_9FIRM|nr:hypothetical protein [Acidaminococcus intestini]
MAKTVYTKGVTPIGEAYFARLISPEVYQGKSTNKFTLMLKLAPKDKEKLLKLIDAEWQKFTESEEGRRHKYKYDYINGIKEYSGEEYFKFKMTHIIQTARGPWERTVPVFDSACQALKLEDELGNGSKVKVAFELSPFYISDKNYGVSLRLVGVQVLSIESTGDAHSMGFGTEEGFVQSDADVLDDSMDMMAEDDDGGDF